MEWGPPEIIALVAAMGTILAVLVTGVSIYLNSKGSERRLESEERRHTERLAHESREAVKAAAAEAYSKANTVLHFTSIRSIVSSKASPLGASAYEDLSQAGIDAQNALSVVRALGWSKDVRAKAEKLAAELLSSTVAFNEALEIMRSKGENDDAFKLAREKAADALEEYRKAIAE